MLLICSFTGAQVEANENTAEKLLKSGSFSLPAETNDAETNDAETNDAETNDAETNDAETKPKARTIRKAPK